MKKKSFKLRLSRETLHGLDPADLSGAAGASDTCASVCIGMCGPTQTCLSQCALCPTQPYPTRRNC